MSRAPRGARTINLALQGGGAHGAFTWGVLDRLLEDGRIEFDGISGTSAGAINGAALASGLVSGGREAARQALDRLWHTLIEQGRFSPLSPSPLDRLLSTGDLSFSPGYQLFETMSRLVSPYFAMPLAQEALRDILHDVLDLACLRRRGDLRLFVSATNVRTGRIKVFTPGEITVDALLASACLPHLHRAVEIDGESYWDGGFMGNPALFPILNMCDSRDIVLVQINPFHSAEVPKTARQILDRMNEISFNATLLRELRTIAIIDDLLARGLIHEESGMKRAYFHRIEAEAEMAGLGASSKLNLDRDFVLSLRDLGRRTASEWLTTAYAALGDRSTLDISNISI